MSITAKSVTPLFEVFDMRRSIAFYCDVLGFVIDHKWEPDGRIEWAMLKLGGAVLMLNSRYERNEQPAQPDAGRVVGHVDTELYFDCPDVDAAYSFLRAKGLDVKEPQNTHYGMRQLSLSDPDGFHLCFQQRI